MADSDPRDGLTAGLSGLHAASSYCPTMVSPLGSPPPGAFGFIPYACPPGPGAASLSTGVPGKQDKLSTMTLRDGPHGLLGPLAACGLLSKTR